MFFMELGEGSTQCLASSVLRRTDVERPERMKEVEGAGRGGKQDKVSVQARGLQQEQADWR